MAGTSAAHLFKDLVIGAAGGLVGTLAMSAYWKAISRAGGQDPRGQTRSTNGQTTSIALLGTHYRAGESSTAALARLGVEAVDDRDPTPAQKHRLSTMVHWSYGAAQGAVLAALSPHLPGPVWAQGLAWGAGMWLVGDELAVGLVGLSDGPRKFPLRQHAHRFGAHLAYGLVAAVVSQGLGRMDVFVQ